MSLPNALRALLMQEALKAIAPNGLNDENSRVCCSCNERKHKIFTSSLIVIEKNGYVYLPFKIKPGEGHVNKVELQEHTGDLLGPPKHICSDCIRFAFECLVSVEAARTGRVKEAVEKAIDEGEKERARRN